MNSITAWEVLRGHKYRILKNGSNIIFHCNDIEKDEKHCKVIIWGWDECGAVRYDLGASEHVIKVQ